MGRVSSARRVVLLSLWAPRMTLVLPTMRVLWGVVGNSAMGSWGCAVVVLARCPSALGVSALGWLGVRLVDPMAEVWMMVMLTVVA